MVGGDVESCSAGGTGSLLVGVWRARFSWKLTAVGGKIQQPPLGVAAGVVQVGLPVRGCCGLWHGAWGVALMSRAVNGCSLVMMPRCMSYLHAVFTCTPLLHSPAVGVLSSGDCWNNQAMQPM